MSHPEAGGETGRSGADSRGDPAGGKGQGTAKGKPRAWAVLWQTLLTPERSHRQLSSR